MQIQVNASGVVGNKEGFERWATAELNERLSHLSAEVTRIDVHLNDEHGAKAGPGDTRCTLEARLVHLPAAAVNHHGGTQDDAFRGAADKLKRLLDSQLGKQKTHRDRSSIRRAEEPAADDAAQ